MAKGRSPDFAGILGLKWVPLDMPPAPAVELLYRLIPRFWGQGLATEGSLAALEFGFCELHLSTVVAFAVEMNTGSRRVMEKVGVVYGSVFDPPVDSRIESFPTDVLNWRKIAITLIWPWAGGFERYGLISSTVAV